MPVLSVVVLLCFLFGGCAWAFGLLRGEPLRARLTMGVSLALLANMWLPALFSFLLGFAVLSQLFAGGAALLLGLGSLLFFKSCEPLAAAGQKDARWLPWACCVLPALLLSAYLLHTHTLLPAENGALMTGQSTYGDMPMHLGFITSIAEQWSFPPDYSILPGTPLGYPFLCDSVSSTYLCLGLPLRLAYMLPSVLALFVVFSSAFLLFETWLKDARKAVLGYVLFFVGAGFGFLYFLPEGGDWSNFTRIFTAFYETPTNYVEENIKWVNPIADLLIPQRATLYGWSVLFPALWLLFRAVFRGERRFFPLLGVLGGALPLIHTHSFLALALVSAVLLCFDLHRAKKAGEWKAALRPWLRYAITAAVLALPQLVCFTFRQSGHDGFLRFGLNWANDGDNYFWFYIKNIGLPYLLLLPAFLLASKESKQWYCGGLLILLLCEFIIFQPNPYDNNKLLYIWHLMTCGLVGGFLVDLYDRLGPAPRRTRAAFALPAGAGPQAALPGGESLPAALPEAKEPAAVCFEEGEAPRGFSKAETTQKAPDALAVEGAIPAEAPSITPAPPAGKTGGRAGRAVLLAVRGLAATLVLLVCCIGGVLTLGREVVSEYELFSPAEVEAAKFVKARTPLPSVFLTANNHDNFVAALTGRNIVCGSGSYLYYHGLDYGEAEESLKTLYETPAAFDLWMAGVDYVVIGSHERSSYRVDTQWFERHCALVFENAGVRIYKTPIP